MSNTKEFKGILPKISTNSYIDENACIIGDVSIGGNCSIWPYVVLRGDMLPIKIGDNCNIQDGSILHTTHKSKYNPEGFALSIGSNVTIGHKVLLHGCKISDNTLIGMGSIVMDGSTVQSNVIVAAGSLVPQGKILESGYLWMGSPVKKIRKLTSKEIEFIKYSAENYSKLSKEYMQ